MFIKLEFSIGLNCVFIANRVLLKYIIEYTLSNGDQEFVKMRWLRYTKKSVYSRCSNAICNAKINMKIVSTDLIVSNGPKRFKLSKEVTDDAVLNIENYGATEHKCRKCLPSRDDDGFCDSTRHRPECFKDISEAHTVRVRVIQYITCLSNFVASIQPERNE